MNARILMTLLLAILGAFVLTGAEPGEPQVAFEIEDQFGERYSPESFRGAIQVWIGSDRHGTRYNSQWSARIRSGIKSRVDADQVQWVALADLRGVPFFVRRMVRARFPKDRDQWVLLDWNGVIPRAYAFVEGQSNVLIFDQSGKLVRHVHGTDPDDASVQAVVETILGLSRQPPP